MAVQPITPELAEAKSKIPMPDAVIESFNELITENYLNGEATFTKNAVVSRMESKGLTRSEIYKYRWLNVGGIYTRWIVSYSDPGPKPGYTEIFEPTFTFRADNK